MTPSPQPLGLLLATNLGIQKFIICVEKCVSYIHKIKKWQLEEKERKGERDASAYLMWRWHQWGLQKSLSAVYKLEWAVLSYRVPCTSALILQVVQLIFNFHEYMKMTCYKVPTEQTMETQEYLDIHKQMMEHEEEKVEDSNFRMPVKPLWYLEQICLLRPTNVRYEIGSQLNTWTMLRP